MDDHGNSVAGPVADALRDDVATAGDHLDDILESYNFVCHPEARVKFVHELKSCRIGVCVAKPWELKPRLRVTVKPEGEDNKVCKYVQKVLLIPTHSQVCLFSSKIHMGWLRLQFMAGYNWEKQRPTLDYRITTKWSDGPKFKRKERYKMTSNTLLRCKWNLDLHLPDLEGHLGVDEGGLEAVDVDYGRMEFEISQLDLVLESPWSYDRSRSSELGAGPSADSYSLTSLPPPTTKPEPILKPPKASAKLDPVMQEQPLVVAANGSSPGLPQPPQWWDNMIDTIATKVMTLPGISSPGGK